MNEPRSVGVSGSREYTYLSALFVGSIVAANLMGTKIIPFFTIGDFTFTGSVGILLFPLSFLVTDIMTEIWGAKTVRPLVGATVAILFVILGVTGVATLLPPAERFAELDAAYATIFRNSLRIIAASIVAFALSQSHDVWAFELWRKATKGRMLWLRNNASTMVSQLIDTVVFMLIAFWGTTDRFTLPFVLGSMVPPYYVLKVLTAVADTPLVYLGVRLIRRSRAPEPGVEEVAVG